MQIFDIVAVSVGKPQQVSFKNQQIETAIDKKRVTRSIYLRRLNFDGDLQADQKNHGGPDKAVCGYCYSHYEYWNQRLGLSLTTSAFGENLTIAGLTEAEARIGDIFALDEAIVQISQPRKPCYKLAAKHGWKTLPVLIEETGYTGFYFRVLKEGLVSPSPKLKLIEPNEGGLSVAEVNRLLFNRPLTRQALETLLGVTDLAEGLKASLRKKLLKIDVKG
ncbi:MOSC domain-containing protein [Camelliibacillus cellulosilyticus]|uniref:MOSC domain-containing protein n=1 Tax=Camelliibacillus cellulosilyticus TaxID=2174486 RepID=A0ABV9GNP5_9BACL